MILLPSLFNVSFALTSCINLLVTKIVSPTDLVVLVSDNIEVNATVMRIGYKYETFTHFPNIPYASLYIIEGVTSKHNLLKMWKVLFKQNQNIYNPSAKFLFIEKDFPYDYISFVRFAISTEAIFLNTDTKTIHTFIPKKISIYDNAIVELHKILECDQLLIEEKNISLFYSDGNLKDSMLLVLYKESEIFAVCTECNAPGIEIEMFEIIFQHLNITHLFYSSLDKKGFNYPDLMIGGNIFVGNYMKLQTISYLQDYLKFFVPSSRKLDRWRYILLVFSPGTWIFFFSSILLVVIAFIVVKVVNKDHLSTSEFISIIVLGRTRRCRATSITLELVILLVVFWSVMLNYLFCSRLRFLLNGISYEKGIEGPEDIVENKMTVATNNDFFHKMLTEMPEFRNYSQEFIVICNETVECMQRGLLRGDIAFFVSTKHMRPLLQYIRDRKTGGTIFRELEPSYFTAYVRAIVIKPSFILSELNRYLTYLLESGITERIIKKYDVPIEEQPTLEPIEKLKFEHIVAPLVILTVGLMLSVIIFFWELNIRNTFF
ncbi:hypothetical protein WA026_011465 [Henosepilachna vigintioctopunctata]|uniref:Ionotropic receptor n=1 Tax=Henosepilachna vigintioctopunctata TaxID=420089 RepID=A0AAW1TVJ4_9CUCU